MVAPLIAAAGISAAGSLLGGFLNSNSAADAAEKAGERNAALQREFAQNSLQWKAEDARKAGIHPIYAMGAPTYQATPSYIAADTSAFGAGIANAGQDIGRAIDTTRTATQKISAYTATAQKLELERAQLMNDNLRADLAAKVSRGIQQPAFPTPDDPYRMPGQAQSGVTTQALVRNASADGRPNMEAGSINDVGFARTRTGFVPIPSSDVKQRIEDNLVQELLHAWRNNVQPTLGFNDPPPHKAAPGHAWQWNPLRQEYYQVKLRSN